MPKKFLIAIAAIILLGVAPTSQCSGYSPGVNGTGYVPFIWNRPLSPAQSGHLWTMGYDGCFSTGLTDGATNVTTNPTAVARIQAWMTFPMGCDVDAWVYPSSGTITLHKEALDSIPAQGQTTNPGKLLPIDANIQWTQISPGGTCANDNSFTPVPENGFTHSGSPATIANRLTAGNTQCSAANTYIIKQDDPFALAYFKNEIQSWDASALTGGNAIVYSSNCPQNAGAPYNGIEYPDNQTFHGILGTAAASLQPYVFICDNIGSGPNLTQITDLNGFTNGPNLMPMCEGCLITNALNGSIDYAGPDGFAASASVMSTFFPDKFLVLLDKWKQNDAGSVRDPFPDGTNGGQINARLISLGTMYLMLDGVLDENVAVWPEFGAQGNVVANAFPTYPEMSLVPFGALKNMTSAGVSATPPAYNGPGTCTLCPGQVISQINGGGSGCQQSGTTAQFDTTAGAGGGAFAYVVKCGSGGASAVVASTPTTTQTYTVTINGHAVVVNQTTGNTLAQEATAIANAINADGTDNVLVTASTDTVSRVEIATKNLGVYFGGNTGWTVTQSGGATLTKTNVNCGALGSGCVAGIYIREFKSCYNFKVLIGAGQCAVIVNTTSTAYTPSIADTYLQTGLPALTQQYNAYLDASHGISGGDVANEDGGGAQCGNGPCPLSVLNPLANTFTYPNFPVVKALSATFLYHT